MVCKSGYLVLALLLCGCSKLDKPQCGCTAPVYESDFIEPPLVDSDFLVLPLPADKIIATFNEVDESFNLDATAYDCKKINKEWVCTRK